jgi:hypothetical protein
MKKILITLTLGFVSLTCAAQADLLVGNYGHGYTKKKGEAVWEIKDGSAQYQLVTLNDEEPPPQSHEFSESERRELWKTMWWPEQSSVSASCIGSISQDVFGNSVRVICHVPPKARAEIGDLKNYKSNYFYRDPVAGLMEIQKLSK